MLSAIAHGLLRLGGWTVVGEHPRVDQALVIAAPHTSNWDGFWALVYKVAVRLDIRFFAKHTLFWFPLGSILRALGGIPLDRTQAASAVDLAVAMYRDEPRFYFGLAPEGTRKRMPGWKSGFYRIALAADVPVIPGFLDFGSRRIGIGEPFRLSGDYATDRALIASKYTDVVGRWPEKMSPIEWQLRDAVPPRRAVRSFVRRTGRVTASQQKALDELWPVYGVEHDAMPLDFPLLFGRDAPRVLEIGFGNGDTLVEMAAAAPERDFLGVEVHEPGIGHCLIRARDAGIDNLRLIAHDAIEVLDRQIPLASLTRVNLYFPDPWPKKRHHKRRIVQPAFLERIADRLRPGGRLYIATDWANYAEHIDAALAASSRFETVTRRAHDGDQPLDRPRTKFEARGLRKGHRIVDWCVARTR